MARTSVSSNTYSTSYILFPKHKDMKQLDKESHKGLKYMN